jgi:hypothetical protein
VKKSLSSVVVERHAESFRRGAKVIRLGCIFDNTSLFQYHYFAQFVTGPADFFHVKQIKSASKYYFPKKCSSLNFLEHYSTELIKVITNQEEFGVINILSSA